MKVYVVMLSNGDGGGAPVDVYYHEESAKENYRELDGYYILDFEVI